MDAAEVDNSSQPTPPKKKPRKWFLIAMPFAALALCLALIGGIAVMYLNYSNSSRAQPFAEWGPEYSTPGTSLTLIEVDRKQIAAGAVVTYSLVATGLSTDQTYTLSLMNFLDETPSPLDDIRVDASGRLSVADTGELIPDFELSKYAKGQPFYIGLISADHGTKVFAKAVPHPIEATDGKGCRLSAELSTRSGTTFSIFGQGYEPNEKLAVSMTPMPELAVVKDNADGTGSFRMSVDQSMARYEVGSTGSGVLDVRVAGTKCDLTVHFQWGPPALELQ